MRDISKRSKKYNGELKEKKIYLCNERKLLYSTRFTTGDQL